MDQHRLVQRKLHHGNRLLIDLLVARLGMYFNQGADYVPDVQQAATWWLLTIELQ